MAGKNGKKGNDVGPDEVEDKGIPKPEAPIAQSTAAVEPPKENPTPEGQDTYVSQQLFGQKTYDEQMKVEKNFAGLNRTDEISQLGGASKLEVDLAQMKIFSTERIGDDLYAAIQRGDTHKVEAMAGLNSDRRLTEAQILVLLKAKREHDDDVAKKLAADAYFTQELEGKKKHDDDEATVRDHRADEQNAATAENNGEAEFGYMEPDYSLRGYDEYNNYHDEYGGYTDPAGTYHDAFGGELDSNNIYHAADGDVVDVATGYHYDNQTGETVIRGTEPGEADVHIPAVMTTSTGEPTTADDRRIFAEVTATDIHNDTSPSAAPAPGADAAVDTTRTAPSAASADGGAIRAPAAIARPAEGDSVGQASASIAMSGRPARGTISIGANNVAAHASEEQKLLHDTNVAVGNTTSGQLWERARETAANKAREELRGKTRGTPEYAAAQQKLERAMDTSSEAYIDFLRDTAKDPKANLTTAQRQAFESTAGQLTRELPVIRGRTRALADAKELAAKESVAYTPPVAGSDASSDTTAPSPVTAAVDTTALQTEKFDTFYDDKGFYHDEYGGYYDNVGGYYDKDGGYRDNDGTYYAADGGIFDTKGGYEWPDGSYEDAHGNYVDANGVLYAVDGTILKPEDHPTESKWGTDFKRMLKDAAEKDNTVNPFDPATGPSAAKTDAFINSKPSWANKTEEEKAEWRATRDIASNYFKSDGYMEVASLPTWDPATQLYSDDTLNPLKPSGPSVMMA